MDTFPSFTVMFLTSLVDLATSLASDGEILRYVTSWHGAAFLEGCSNVD